MALVVGLLGFTGILISESQTRLRTYGRLLVLLAVALYVASAVITLSDGVS